MIEESGAQIIGYDSIDEIGQSSYATTYLARQHSPDRIVSLKILKSSKFDADELRALFYNAAKIVKLEHANIATIYDIAVFENQHYVASEYIPGQSLKHRAKTGFLPDQILDMMMCLVEALSYAHKKGVAHQNIKLENIMVRQDGTIVLTDFGLGVGLKKNLAAFNASLVNTLDNVKIQWDTFSVGTSLYELLTGKVYKKAINGVEENELPEDTRFLYPLLNRLLDPSVEDYINNMQLLKVEIKNLLNAIPTLGKEATSTKIETRPKPKRITPKPNDSEIKPLDNQISLGELIQYFISTVKDKFAKRKQQKKNQQNQIQKSAPVKNKQQNSNTQHASKVARQELAIQSEPTAIINNERFIKKVVVGATVVVVLAAMLVTIPSLKTEDDAGKVTQKDSNSKASMVTAESSAKFESKTSKLEKLFQQADLLWGKNYLTKPKDNNVYAVYLDILELDQNNQRAREGIARIANYFEQRAQRKKGDGNLENSLADVMSGLKIQPNHAGLIILKSELQSRIEEQKSRQSQTVAQPQATPPQLDENSTVNRLLDTAELQWRDKKLVSPPGDNAYETYVKALEIDASNKRAALGLTRMAIYFEGRAENSLQDDAFQESLNFVEQALKITPENERLILLRDELKEKVAEVGSGVPEDKPKQDDQEEQANVFGNF